MRPISQGLPPECPLQMTLQEENNQFRLHLSVEFEIMFNDERNIVIGLECGELSGLLDNWGELFVEELT